jgi:hypothetical protein
MTQPVLVPGGIYQSTTHGMVEFQRVDSYMGQQTLQFRSITYSNSNAYVLPERLAAFLGLPKEEAA